MITIDVEAQPRRASESHVERLIWGRFPEGGGHGLDKILEVASRHDVGTTSYLDYAEADIYGNTLFDVGREIDRRGHDLQLHLHQEFFSDAFYRRARVDRPANLNSISAAASRAIVDELIDRHIRSAKVLPIAFRGGGYRFNDALLKELASANIKFDSSYNASRATKPIDLGQRRQFFWNSGIFELPISTVHNFKGTGRFFDYNFNADVLLNAPVGEVLRRHSEFLEKFYAQFGEDAIAVLVMHSFSLLSLGISGHYEPCGNHALDRFEAFLDHFKGKLDFITAKDVAALIDRNAIPSDRGIAFESTAQETSNRKASTGAHEMIDMDQKENLLSKRRNEVCPICDTPKSVILAVAGARKCPGCGSVERQRVVADLYEELGDSILPISGKRVLAIAPSDSEIKFLSAAGAREVVVVDVRPEVRPDVLADICDMKAIANASFDAIVASYVLTYVHDLKAALREFDRVLTPGGLLLVSDPVAHGQLTRPVSQPHEVMSWYGKEAFDAYRVGNFRIFGAEDATSLLGQCFPMNVYWRRDPVTDSEVAWFVGRKPAESIASSVEQAVARPSREVDVLELERIARAGQPYRNVEWAVRNCTRCGDPLVEPERGENCPKCGSRPRLRTLKPLMENLIVGLAAQSDTRDLPLLTFATTDPERDFLKKAYSQFKSVSLFGSYGDNHQIGVDSRDLSAFADNSFAGYFGILLFDYFPEHDAALKEAFRVVAPGGILFTHIAGYRLLDSDAPPFVQKVIKGRPGYFEYLPVNQDLPDIKVGGRWFVSAMARAGFRPMWIQIDDVPSGQAMTWFVGIKPVSAESISSDTAKGSLGSSFGLGAPSVHRSDLTQSVSQTRSTPLPAEMGFRRIAVTLSLPTLPMAGESARFALHCFDRNRREAANTVIACQAGGVAISEDLGAHWDVVSIPQARDIALHNAFDRQGGGYLLQGLGPHKPSDPRGKPDSEGPIFVCDEKLGLIERVQPAKTNWHGPRSIDQSGNTIMFAEYPENGTKYTPAFAQSADGLTYLCDNSRVFRSVDGGRTWSNAFERSWREIRHFHTLMADPFEPGTWYLSSGDRSEESFIWRSSDDGDSWEDVTATGDSVDLHPGMASRRRSIHRHTDMVVLPDRLIWGADDLLGNVSDYHDPKVSMSRRVGSRLFMSPKTSPLQPVCIGFVGSHIRSIVDVGPGYLVLTEAKYLQCVPRPQVAFLSKEEPYRVVELFSIDRFSASGTAFTGSRASRAAKNGRFFTARQDNDAFVGGPRILQWDVDFD